MMLTIENKVNGYTHISKSVNPAYVRRIVRQSKTRGDSETTITDQEGTEYTLVYVGKGFELRKK